jgi:ABC-type nickel/cobalt efflux system permease component RcnA
MFTATEGDSDDYEAGDDESVHSQDMHHCSHHHHHHHHHHTTHRRPHRQAQSQRNVQLVTPLGSSASTSKNESGRLLEPCPEPVSVLSFELWKFRMD